MSRAGNEQAGATRVTDDSHARRRPWWLWLLLGLLALGVLLFALSRCGNGDPSATGNGTPAVSPAPTAEASASAAATSAPAAAGSGGGSGSGSLTAGTTSLLPLAAVAGANGDLTSQVGQPATATAASVQGVPADEGFWVGTSSTDRVWVQLTGPAGESGYTVKQGDRVTFTGKVVAHDAGFAAASGVDAAAGADQLTGQRAHIEVAKSDLRGVTR